MNMAIYTASLLLSMANQNKNTLVSQSENVPFVKNHTYPIRFDLLRILGHPGLKRFQGILRLFLLVC